MTSSEEVNFAAVERPPSHAEKLAKLKTDIREVLGLSLTFCLLWFTSTYFYNYGLEYASITSSVVLSNTAPMWVYVLALSCIVPANHREKFEPVKAGMIALSLAGFGLIALQDSKSSSSKTSHELLGDILTVASAMSYAIYATYLKIKVPKEKEETFRFSAFLGFVGIFNDVIMLPVILIFNWTGLETFEWPNRETWLLLSTNALIGTVISDYCWARSVVLLGPLITSLGITLTFPISLMIDVFYHGKTFTFLYILGSIFIFTAFGVITLYKRPKKDENN